MLQLQGIQKRFGGVTALSDGNLTVDAGQVHLLLGENGAGKSTLMKIVAGMHQRDAGRMLWNGEEVHLTTPKQAAQIGVAMVHQESLLAPHLSVAENIFLGNEDRHPLGLVNRRRMVDQANRLIEEHHFPLRGEWTVGRLSPAGKQLVEICRAIQNGSSLLIFDEPTSSLSDAETLEVFRIVRQLRDRKMGVIYITHRLEELRAIGDRVTIFRDGRDVHTSDLASVTTDEIIHHMVGREVSAIYERTPQAPGAELLRVDQLTRKGVLDSVSLTLHAGEIVGLAGLIGAGRTELCRAIFGIDPVDSGSIRINGKPAAIRSPRDAVRAGLAFVTEDRQKTGLALRLPVAANTVMANVPAVSPHGLLRKPAEARITSEYIAKMRIRATAGSPAKTLSGGNQQKVVIARWLFRDARVFLFDEPTRGIDVGAKAEVFELMDSLARQGAALLMVSSELPELLQVADRVLVMRQGRIAGELARGASQADVMRLATLTTARENAQ